MSADTFKPKTDLSPKEIANAQSPAVIGRSVDRIGVANGHKSIGGYIDPRDYDRKAQGEQAPKKPGY